jgi:hypothetical protein
VLSVNPGKVLFTMGCCHKREKETGKKPNNKIRKKTRIVEGERRKCGFQNKISRRYRQDYWYFYITIFELIYKKWNFTH